MRVTRKSVLIAAAFAGLLCAGAALAQIPGAIGVASIVFETNRGDIAFPFTPPNVSTGAPGTIQKMTIIASGSTPIACDTTPCALSGLSAAQGGEIDVQGGTSSTSANAGGASKLVGGAPGATGVGGAATVIGGAGGSTSGAGGAVAVTGGAGTAGNANGGDVTIAGGAANGSGVNGVTGDYSRGASGLGAPAAATTSATLTAANVLSGIITVLQGGGANSAQQLPLATAMDTALPTSVAGDAFDFSVINISTTSGETSSVTTNTGWTLVGGMTQAITTSARFRARKTGTGAWTLYRLS